MSAHSVLQECWVAANEGDLARCRQASATLSIDDVLNYVEPNVLFFEGRHHVVYVAGHCFAVTGCFALPGGC